MNILGGGEQSGPLDRASEIRGLHGDHGVESSGFKFASLLAGAIANNIREGKAVELVAMGAPNSVNQAIKAVAIAREYLKGGTI